MNEYREELIRETEDARQNFLRTLRPLDESNSSYCPTPDMWTAAQQVFHAGSGINWFREGTFGTGFRAAHEAHEGDEATAQSLNKAVDHFNGAFDLLIDELRNASDVDLQKPLPPDAPMTGRVRDVVSAVIDHTAHHRGAIQTYVRLLGKEPVSPYKQKTGAGNRPENVPHI